MEILNYTNNMNQFNYTQYLKENPLMRELSEDESITAQTHDEGKRVKDLELTVKVDGHSVIFTRNDNGTQGKISKEALKNELAKQDPTITIGGEKVVLYNSKPTLEKMVSGVKDTDGEGSYKNPMLEFGDAEDFSNHDLELLLHDLKSHIQTSVMKTDTKVDLLQTIEQVEDYIRDNPIDDSEYDDDDDSDEEDYWMTISEILDEVKIELEMIADNSPAFNRDYRSIYGPIFKAFDNLIPDEYREDLAISEGSMNLGPDEELMEEGGNSKVDAFVKKVRDLTQKMANSLSDDDLEYLKLKLQKWADSGFQAMSL